METTKFVYDACRHYLSDRTYTLPAPVVAKLSGYLRARDVPKLASCSDLIPVAKQGREGRRTLLQVEAFFKKASIFADPTRCRETAITSFLRGEEMCRASNRRIDSFYFDHDHSDPDIELWINRMVKHIGKVLGPFDTFLRSLPEYIKVTSGATASRSRKDSLRPLRLSKRAECYPGSLPYLDALSKFFGYGSFKGKVTRTNRVEFVPKNYKTDRTIACEPEGAVALQLAFDRFTKMRLRKFGIDLSDQSRNQDLAREGSIYDNLSTIDLSMASDTVSFNAVALLLPNDWLTFLKRNRAEFGGGSVDCKYAKFSSMGNGATFALETLIFFSACKAVGSKRCSVYGDDIIIEAELTCDLIKLLGFLGFVVNEDKSFTSGPFRESCGGNYYAGCDITPFYVRELDGRKAVMSHTVNGLASIAEPYGNLWSFLRLFIETEKLPFVPYNDDTMSGVFLHPYYAYSKKLIRTRYSIPKFKSFKMKTSTRVFVDVRALFLWHLDAFQHPDRGAFSSISTSLATISSHKYVRKWVHWKYPVAGVADHSFEWSAFVLRVS